MSVTHQFELPSENPIYRKARRISSSHIDIVRKEIYRMLLAVIITPVESSWTSPVVTATKIDGSPAVLYRLSEIELGDACRSLAFAQSLRNS